MMPSPYFLSSDFPVMTASQPIMTESRPPPLREQAQVPKAGCLISTPSYLRSAFIIHSSCPPPICFTTKGRRIEKTWQNSPFHGTNSAVNLWVRLKNMTTETTAKKNCMATVALVIAFCGLLISPVLYLSYYALLGNQKSNGRSEYRGAHYVLPPPILGLISVVLAHKARHQIKKLPARQEKAKP